MSPGRATSAWADAYGRHAEALYLLCWALEAEVERAERLYHEVWRGLYRAASPAGGEPSQRELDQGLVEAFRRLARLSQEDAGPPLQVAVRRLPPEHRLPLVLREWGQRSYAELAEALDWPVPTVRATLARARTQLLGPAEASAGATPIDDELLSALADGELDPSERHAVGRLIEAEPSWKRRAQQMKELTPQLQALPQPALSGARREIVWRSVTESFALGAERRRVPRYRRRWILLAAFLVPTVLTLWALQNPTQGGRLYLRQEGLTLQAGRTGLEERVVTQRSWRSAPLWGEFQGSADQPDPGATFSLRLDAEGALAPPLRLNVRYDFDGDEQPDRIERYRPLTLEPRRGWQREQAVLESHQGGWSDFSGGRVEVHLELDSGRGVLFSGAAGELVLPYRQLRGQPER